MDSNNHPFILTLGIIYSDLSPIPVVAEAIVVIWSMVIYVFEVIAFVVPAVEEVATLPLLRAVTVGERQNIRLSLMPPVAPAGNVVDAWA